MCSSHPFHRIFLLLLLLLSLSLSRSQSYLHLSVAFIQMMKAFSPATTMAGLAMLGKPVIKNEVHAVGVRTVL